MMYIIFICDINQSALEYGLPRSRLTGYTGTVSLYTSAARAVVFALAAGLSASAHAFEVGSQTKITVQQESLVYDNAITGSDPTGSYLTPGGFSVHNVGLILESMAGDTRLEAAVDGRMTDDDRYEPRRYNLKRAYVRASRENFGTLELGDFFATFSPYTLGTSLKGVQVQAQLAQEVKVTVLGGTDKAEWGDVYLRNRNEALDRNIVGGRVSANLFRKVQIGFSGVNSRATRAFFNTTSPSENQHVFGLDWNLPRTRGLTLSGESALSETVSIAAATGARSNNRGQANKLRADYLYKRFSTRNEFERVNPHFATTNGGASPDLFRVKTDNSWNMPGPWKWLVLNYAYYHNNLRKIPGTATVTTRILESGLRYESPEWRPALYFESKLRHREATYTIGGLRRRTRSVIAGIGDRIGPIGLTTDFEFQHEDQSDGAKSQRHFIVGIGLDSMLRRPTGWSFAQSIRWNLQRDRDNLVAKTDQVTNVNINLRTVSPWGVDAGLTFRRNLAMPALSPGNDSRMASASLGWNILKNDAHRIEIRFKQNDYRFQTASQDFKESVWELALNSRF